MSSCEVQEPQNIQPMISSFLYTLFYAFNANLNFQCRPISILFPLHISSTSSYQVLLNTPLTQNCYNLLTNSNKNNRKQFPFSLRRRSGKTLLRKKKIKVSRNALEDSGFRECVGVESCRARSSSKNKNKQKAPESRKQHAS